MSAEHSPPTILSACEKSHNIKKNSMTKSPKPKDEEQQVLAQNDPRWYLHEPDDCLI